MSFAALYPERVEKLLLESASPGLETTDEQLARQAKDKTLAEMIRDKGIDTFVSYWENIPLFRTQDRLSQQAKTAIREERLAQDPGGSGNLYLVWEPVINLPGGSVCRTFRWMCSLSLERLTRSFVE